MVPQPLSESVPDLADPVEMSDGITVSEHEPTDGVMITRSDWAFDGGPVVIPKESVGPLAAVLVQESTRAEGDWVLSLTDQLSREQKAALAKSLIDEVAPETDG